MTMTNDNDQMQNPQPPDIICIDNLCKPLKEGKKSEKYNISQLPVRGF